MNGPRFVFKLMILGDPSVGKTSLVRRYIENRFSEDYLSTIGVDFLKKDINVDGTYVTIVLWDVAGQAKYANFKKHYYKGANFFIIVFDITKKPTYMNIGRWLKDAQEILGDDVYFAIFANKADLEDQREVEDYEAFKLMENLVEFEETSAKTGHNVNEIFTKIARFLIEKLNNQI